MFHHLLPQNLEVVPVLRIDQHELPLLYLLLFLFPLIITLDLTLLVLPHLHHLRQFLHRLVAPS
jgi:hypothetical protein